MHLLLHFADQPAGEAFPTILSGLERLHKGNYINHIDSSYTERPLLSRDRQGSVR